MRTCARCGKDITGSAHSRKRCPLCARERRREQSKRWNEDNKKNRVFAYNPDTPPPTTKGSPKRYHWDKINPDRGARASQAVKDRLGVT